MLAGRRRMLPKAKASRPQSLAPHRVAAAREAHLDCSGRTAATPLLACMCQADKQYSFLQALRTPASKHIACWRCSQLARSFRSHMPAHRHVNVAKVRVDAESNQHRQRRAGAENDMWVGVHGFEGIEKTPLSRALWPRHHAAYQACGISRGVVGTLSAQKASVAGSLSRGR
jgi:hypothetical protein